MSFLATDEKKVYIGDGSTAGGNPVSLGELNIQSDWAQSDNLEDDFIKNKPSTFAPSAHTHTSTDVTDFQASVTSNTNVAANTAARHTHSNISILNAITEAFTTTLKTAYDSTVTWITTNGATLIAILTNTSNPHSVTKAQVGLSNVDNTSDLNKVVSTATQTALDLKSWCNSYSCRSRW